MKGCFEVVEYLAICGRASLKGSCMVDGPMLSLTHSGKTTALNNCCTDTPLSLASADITWNASSRMDSMNLAMANFSCHLFSPVRYITIYTRFPTKSAPRASLPISTRQISSGRLSSVCSEWLV
jgi:hypothetical protein